MLWSLARLVLCLERLSLDFMVHDFLWLILLIVFTQHPRFLLRHLLLGNFKGWWLVLVSKNVGHGFWHDELGDAGRLVGCRPCLSIFLPASQRSRTIVTLVLSCALCRLSSRSLVCATHTTTECLLGVLLVVLGCWLWASFNFLLFFKICFEPLLFFVDNLYWNCEYTKLRLLLG